MGALMDAQSLTEEELLATKYKNYAIGGQEQYMMTGRINEKHDLVYFPDMTQSEILVFKQGAYTIGNGTTQNDYSVVPEPNRHHNHILHAAFVDPNAPTNALPRKSVVCHLTIIMKET